MSDELRELLFGQLLPGILTVVAAVVGGYLSRKGWKGMIARRILNGVIEEVVDRLNATIVPRMKAETQTDHPELGYDLTTMQARSVMYKAKTEIQDLAVARGVPKEIIPPTTILQDKIERVVQAKKLDGQRRLGKGR